MTGHSTGSLADRYGRGGLKRYPGSAGIEPDRPQQVIDDVDLAALHPDPKSRMGTSRFFGLSDDAGRVLVVNAFGMPKATRTGERPLGGRGIEEADSCQA